MVEHGVSFQGYRCYKVSGVRLKLQVTRPSTYFTEPDKDGRIWFNQHCSPPVWPNQIPAAGTVSRDGSAYKGPPPADAVEELWQHTVTLYFAYLEYANRKGFAAEPVPRRPIPVWYNSDANRFETTDGRKATGEVTL